MTRGSILEYTEAVRWRYLKAGKKKKGRILDEFIQVTSYHRKAAIRLLRRDGSQRQGKRRGCRRRYGYEVVDALRKVWEASDRLCSKRLKPFFGELVKVMRQHGELGVNARTEAELCRMSPFFGRKKLLKYCISSQDVLSYAKETAGAVKKGVVPVYGTRVIVGRGRDSHFEDEQRYGAKVVSRPETSGGEDR